MVFQSYALYPHMTVRENMALRRCKLAKTPTRPPSTQKVDEAAQVLDLTEHLDRKPANLSGGQRQRVAMGRAIVRDPKAFLMDEPLSNLDAKLRVQMRTEVSRLQKRLGTTTVYVTHDQTEAMTLGDRVVVMRSGVVQQVGAAAGALRPPAQPLRRRLHRLAGDELPARPRWRTASCAPRWATCARRPDAPGAGTAERAPRGDRRHPAGGIRGRGPVARPGPGRARLHRHRGCTGVDGLRRVRLLHARRAGPRRPPSWRSWPRTPGLRDTGADSRPDRGPPRRRHACP